MRKFIYSTGLFCLMLFCLMLFFLNAYSQSDYEKQIASLANTISERIIQSGKLRVAISEFLDNNGNRNELGKAISEELSVNLMNVNKGFQVMDRSNLSAILKEHKLATTGLIDTETIKKLGKLKAVDVIVVGTITPYSDYFRMSIKVLDTETGMAFGGTLGNIAKTAPLNELFDRKMQIGTIAGIEKPKQLAKEYQKQEELQLGTGDYCFQNNCFARVIISRSVNIKLYNSENNKLEKTLDVSANQTSCVYKLIEGVYRAEITWREQYMNGALGRQDKTETKEIRIQSNQSGKIVLEY
jgi:TolB-like protein